MKVLRQRDHRMSVLLHGAEAVLLLRLDYFRQRV